MLTVMLLLGTFFFIKIDHWLTNRIKDCSDEEEYYKEF